MTSIQRLFDVDMTSCVGWRCQYRFLRFLDSTHEEVRKIFPDYKLEFSTTGTLQAIPTRRRERRALSVKRYMETMVVADESMFEYYGKKEIELRR